MGPFNLETHVLQFLKFFLDDFFDNFLTFLPSFWGSCNFDIRLPKCSLYFFMFLSIFSSLSIFKNDFLGHFLKFIFQSSTELFISAVICITAF